eukprot:5955678-Amphidinium_carterae.1
MPTKVVWKAQITLSGHILHIAEPHCMGMVSTHDMLTIIEVAEVNAFRLIALRKLRLAQATRPRPLAVSLIAFSLNVGKTVTSCVTSQALPYQVVMTRIASTSRMFPIFPIGVNVDERA